MSAHGNSSYVLTIDELTIYVTRKRVKNVNFRIDAQGRAVMSVPWHVSRAEAEGYARRQADWFREHLQRRQSKRNAREALEPSSWESGELVRVWGEVLELDVRQADDVPRCSVEDGKLVVCVPHGSTAQGRRQFVERWLVDGMRERLGVLLPECERRIGVRATSLTLRRMKTRWGSCTTKTGAIRLNTALVHYPPECLEMVLVHELCHLIEPNHGPRFYALMDLHFPAWRAVNRLLKE